MTFWDRILCLKYLSVLGDRDLNSDPSFIFNQAFFKSLYMFEPQFPDASKLYLYYRVVRRFQHKNECKVPGWALYPEKVLRSVLLSPSLLTAGLLSAQCAEGGGHKGEDEAWVWSLLADWLRLFVPAIPLFELGLKGWVRFEHMGVEGRRGLVDMEPCKQSLKNGNV